MPSKSERAVDRDLLTDLYKIAVDEYRFNVKLGWDRAKFYLGLHTALGAASVALFRIGERASWAIAILSVVGAVLAWVGFFSVGKGHAYYRRSVVKKTLIEHELGLTARISDFSHPSATLAIGSTESQAKTDRILADTEQWINRGIRFCSVVGHLRAFLMLLSLAHIINVGCQMISLFRYYRGVQKYLQLKRTPGCKNSLAHGT